MILFWCVWKPPHGSVKDFQWYLGVFSKCRCSHCQFSVVIFRLCATQGFMGNADSNVQHKTIRGALQRKATKMAKKTPTCNVSPQSLRVNQLASFFLNFIRSCTDRRTHTTSETFYCCVLRNNRQSSSVLSPRLTLTLCWMIFLGTIRGAREIVTLSKAATATQLCVRANSRPLISHRVGLCYPGFISTSAAGSCQPDELLLSHCCVFSFLFLCCQRPC